MRTLLSFLLITLLAVASVSAKTTIEWWQFWTDPAIKPTIEQMVGEFEKANPDIDVKLTDLTWANGHEKIVIAFASNTAPDIVELGSDWIAQFAANDYIADISADISPDSGNFEGWSMADYNGKIYGRPWILGTRVLFGNRDLLTRAGYDSSWVPITWNDLRESCEKITKLGKNIYGWGSNTAEKHRLYKKFLPFFWNDGAQIFTEDGKYCVISSNYAIDALKFYQLLNDSCGYVANQRGIEDAFLDGKVGMIISGDWLLKRIRTEHRKINLMSTVMPGRKYPGKSFLGGEFLSINAKSKNKDAALKFVRFITSPENQIRFCKANMSANPSSLTAQEDPYFTSDPHLQTFIRSIKSAKHPPVDPNWVYIEDVIEKAVEDALFGQRLPATALRNAQLKITEIENRQ